MIKQDSFLKLNIGGTQVYVAEFDDDIEVQPVLPLARQRQIEQCADEQRKRQHYCVWRLLDYALKQCVGKGVDELELSVDANGKWSCKGDVHFSLSHCRNVVVVAISERAVGVDIEAYDEQRFNSRLAKRILTANEREIYNRLPPDKQAQMLVETWTKKESLFKRNAGKSFVPSIIDTTAAECYTTTVSVGNSKFAISITR